jgi:hypothetical protein
MRLTVMLGIMEAAFPGQVPVIGLVPAWVCVITLAENIGPLGPDFWNGSAPHVHLLFPIYR